MPQIMVTLSRYSSLLKLQLVIFELPAACEADTVFN